MLFKGKKKYNLFSRKQRGVTIIEMILVMSIAIPLILGWLLLQNTAAKNAQIKRLGEQFAEITHAISVRTNHDGFDYSLWQTNGSRVDDTNDYIVWDDTDEVAEDLFRKYLVAFQNPTCGDATEGWNPEDEVIDNIGTIAPNDTMESSALLPCSFYNPVNPFGIELRAVLNKSTNKSHVGKFSLYINLANSKLFDLDNKDALLSIRKLVIASQQASKPNIHGLLDIYLGKVGDINDIDDDEHVGVGGKNDNLTCMKNLIAGDECTLIVSLNFEGSSNFDHLEVNGSNSMFASINFSAGLAGGAQRCVWWQKPDDGTNLGVNETAPVAAWTAKEVDCGIHGGNDSPTYVEAVMDNQYADRFLVGNKANLGHMCRVYEADANGQFIDIAVTDPNYKTPCGILTNGDVIQLATEEAFIGQAYIKDLVVQDIFSNTLEIQQSTAARNAIENDGKGLNALTEYDPADVSILINVLDEGRVEQFTVDSQGNTHVLGELEIDELATFHADVIMEKNLTVSEATTFKMDNGTDIVYGTGIGSAGSLTFNNDTNFDIYTSTGLNLNILASQGILNMQGENGANVIVDNNDLTLENNDTTGSINLNAAGDVVMDAQGGIYTTRNMVNQEILSRTVFDAQSTTAKKDYQLLNYGFGKYLEDKTGNINIRSTVAISSGNNNIVNKPDCLDFVSSNPDRYTNTEALTMANNNEGYNLARLFILPLYFKTYAAALGNNQIFSQHAVHNSSTEWEVYMYLSGEGIQGTGGREDAAGSGIGMIICDFNGINFEG
jgi:hypothetical protein